MTTAQEKKHWVASDLIVLCLIKTFIVYEYSLNQLFQ